MVQNRELRPDIIDSFLQFAQRVAQTRALKAFYWPVSALGCVAIFFLMRMIPGLRVSASAREHDLTRTVIACNHISAFDGFILAYVFWLCRIWFPAKESAYNSYLSAIIWTIFGALHIIPIHRKRPSTSTIRLLRNLLRQGETILIFPKGTRSPPGSIRPFQRGIGLIAATTGAKIIPAKLTFVDNMRPRWVTALFGHSIELRIGQALEYGCQSFDQSLLPSQKSDKMLHEAITRAVHNAVCSL